MNFFIALLIYLLASSFAKLSQMQTILTTADYVRAHGYPSEGHTVQTKDAYILRIFRIPNSPKLRNKKVRLRPAILLMHGLLSNSDAWIVNGPDNALAYLLADAGYDVWMGNARGNSYSKKNAKLSEFSTEFWRFSWNEIGVFDLPAIIDYVLNVTHSNALHYVGHSQGTTSFMVLLSSLPSYNFKIKTSHMLAPVAYMSHMSSPLAKFIGPLLGQPSLLSELIGDNEFLPANKLFTLLGKETCLNNSIFQPICSNAYFLIGGWNSKHINYTAVQDAMRTHPAGCSTSQPLHYLQLYQSGHFRQYDFGKVKNTKIYKQETPPDYVIENIRPPVPLEFYYSDNDCFSSVIDVSHLAKRLGRNVRMYRIKYSDWNHLDFALALEVKEIINERIIKLANLYEDKLRQI